MVDVEQDFCLITSQDGLLLVLQSVVCFERHIVDDLYIHDLSFAFGF